ncbi:MAG: hypothetical protein K5891_08345 [Lachnospiraceae bacterium]|nr:hypothetical protein [Lachnospiraceae bacterium]
MNKTNVVKVKEYSELEFRDDFMFTKTMEDKALCKDVIELLLQHPIGTLQNVQREKEYRTTSDGKPIRLDIYTYDESAVYDAEMQNLNNKSRDELRLPKRSRFYQSNIDSDFLRRGNSYGLLPDSSILFICTFDPFLKDMPIYTFRETCAEDTGLLLDDGVEKLFFNCTYKGEDIPDDLRNFYDFVMSGKVSDDLTSRIQAAVSEARRNEDWRADYMKEMALFMDLKEEGIRAFILDKLEDEVPTDIISERLQRRFGLTEEQALKEIELYSHSVNA